jgi:hypothetical protein
MTHRLKVFASGLRLRRISEYKPGSLMMFAARCWASPSLLMRVVERSSSSR